MLDYQNLRDISRALAFPLDSPEQRSLSAALVQPLSDLVDRPSKRLRSQLVELGAMFALGRTELNSEEQENVRCGSEILELIHAGSLAIDDIEDNSVLRRGEPTLHRKYGVPIALNAGNWLYFWPLAIAEDAAWSDAVKLRFYRSYQRALLRAHTGQALDISVAMDAVPQSEVSAICLSSLRLKSGALVAFAVSLGGELVGASNEVVSSLEEYGFEFGTVLQMLDDLGNAKGQKDPVKRWEDLTLKRPSWFWASVAGKVSSEEYAQFIEGVRSLPDALSLERWLSGHSTLIESSQREAEELLEKAGRKLASFDGRSGVMDRLNALSCVLKKAYL